MTEALPLLAHLGGVPLAYSPARIPALLSRLPGSDFGSHLASRHGRTAVVSVVGPLVARGGLLPTLFGFRCMADVAREVEEAVSASDVDRVVLDVDSFGGEVQGLLEAAERIRAVAEGSPVVAVVNHNACSGGYALAAAAREVVVSRAGCAGSIGVMTVHRDQSGADRKAGLAYTFVHAGERKVEGHPHAPLDDRARATLQARVDGLHGSLCEAVAGFRGLSVGQVRALEADTFSGEAAVRAGLADRVGDLAQVLGESERLWPRSTPSSSRRSASHPLSAEAALRLAERRYEEARATSAALIASTSQGPSPEEEAAAAKRAGRAVAERWKIEPLRRGG